MKKFKTGAYRDSDINKLDFVGSLSPIVLKRFAEYMLKHRFQADGTIRDDGNWKKGVTFDSFMKSGWRHFHDLWMEHEGLESREGMEDALMGLLFNIMGYSHEYLKKK